MTEKDQLKSLVLRVNELFHDIEGEDYHEKHDDIFDGERDRWVEIGKKLKKEAVQPRKILDIGTGTGFVAITLGSYLGPEDTFVCSDISQKILDAAAQNIGKGWYQCQFHYLKTDGERFEGIENASVDVVTVNSVLHHLPDLQSFFQEMERIIRENGRLIIGHEPNQMYFRNNFLRKQYTVISTIIHPKELVYQIARFFRLVPLIKKIFKKDNLSSSNQFRGICEKINAELLRRGEILEPLSDARILELIDFQSPTSGELDTNKGINIPDLLMKYGSNFSLELYETYNHVYRISHKNSFLKLYSKLLSQKYPRDGAALFAILKRRSR